MFILRRHGTRNIAQRWVILYDAQRDQMFQSEQVVLLAHAIQVSPAEGERVKVFVDRPQEAVCRVNADGDGFGEVLLSCVVRAFSLVDNVSSSRRTEGLDGVVFAFLHLDVEVGHGYDGNRFASVDRVTLDAVTVEVLNTLDLVGLALGFDSCDSMTS